MTQRFIPSSKAGTPLLATRPSEDARHLLSLRRSISKNSLTSPGPTAIETTELLTQAMRVPDHRRLGPWRTIVFEGEARADFGRAAVDIQRQEAPETPDVMLATTEAFFLRAPTVIAVISSPVEDPKQTPVWEQQLSVGAVCYNLLLCANAAGWAGCWLTEWIAYSDGINRLLGLEANERVAGYIYLGTAKDDPQERLRPDMNARITRWTSK